MDSLLERIEDLLLKRSLESLDEAETTELQGLLERFPQVDAAAFDRAVAAVSVACVSFAQPMPAGLYAEIEATGKRFVAQQADTRRPAPAARLSTVRPRHVTRNARPRWTLAAVTPWFVAAASAAFAILSWWPQHTGDAGPGLEQRREVLIAGGARLENWTATEDATATGASGDIVWDAATQQGYMRFVMLSANDPEEFQYQLWIFDAERDERFPVDGGIFDVPPGSDEIIVPINAKIPVNEAILFAITVEKPGGVVVSNRERIALLAEFS